MKLETSEAEREEAKRWYNKDAFKVRSSRDIDTLLTRVREATGPDRELDADIWQALCWQDHWREIAKGAPFTASIDAAVALVERVLPGRTWAIVQNQHYSTFSAYIRARETAPDIEPEDYSGDHESSAPLAILAALLSALEQKEGADG